MTVVIEPMLVARPDAAMTAIVDERTPLRYAAGGDPGADVPAHVRAGSALRRMGGRIVIVQDDVHVLAVRDEHGQVDARLLPAGPGGARVFEEARGNKAAKLDLEACVALPDGRLVAMGSGSSPRRETIVVLYADGRIQQRHAPDLYAQLRGEPAFAGSELNVEGLVLRGGELLLLQRGNGAPRDGLQPTNAIGAMSLAAFVSWLDDAGDAPALERIVPVELGTMQGTRLGFTDAASLPDGRIAVLACAEDSPDAIADGPVAGCRFGLLDGHELRMTDVLEVDGRPSQLKLEGIETRPDGPAVFDVVADMDRPEEPAILARLRVHE